MVARTSCISAIDRSSTTTTTGPRHTRTISGMRSRKRIVSHCVEMLICGARDEPIGFASCSRFGLFTGLCCVPPPPLDAAHEFDKQRRTLAAPPCRSVRNDSLDCVPTWKSTTTLARMGGSLRCGKNNSRVPFITRFRRACIIVARA
jgi:hypothetical protein